MEPEMKCDPCECRGLKVAAVKYCKSCQEKQCTICAEVHRSSKATKTHLLVDITLSKSFCKLNSDLEVLQTCAQHTGKELEFYCGEHNALACSLCLFTGRDHRKCTNIVAISTAGDHMIKCRLASKTAEHLTELKQQSKRAMLKLKELKDVGHTGVEIVKDTIQEIRRLLLRVFDIQAENIIKTATTICDKYRVKCSDRLHECKSLVTVLENSCDLLFAVLETERPSDVFRCLMSLHAQLEELHERFTKASKGMSSLSIIVEKSDVIRSVTDNDTELIKCRFEEKQITSFEHCYLNPLRDEFHDTIMQCGEENFVVCKERIVNEQSVSGEPSASESEPGSARALAATENKKKVSQTKMQKAKSEKANVITETSFRFAKSSDDGDEMMQTEAVKLACVATPVVGCLDIDSKRFAVGREKEPTGPAVTIQSKQTNKIILKHAFYFDIPTKSKKHYTADVFGGIVCLADKRLVISDLTKSSLLVVDAEKRCILHEVPTKYPPGRMSVLNGNTLLVCMMQTNKILVMDMKNNKWTSRYIPTRCRPKNVLVIDTERTLVAMVDAEGDWYFEIIKNQGVTSEPLKLRGAYDGQRMCIQKIDACVGNSRVIQFCEVSDAVQCYCLNGQVQFRYNVDECNSVLSDNLGYLYLVRHNGEIYILSPEGKHLSKEYFPSMLVIKFATFDPLCNTVFALTKRNARIHVIHVSRDSGLARH